MPAYTVICAKTKPMLCQDILEFDGHVNHTKIHKRERDDM
jgi:hypothetical protein